MISFENLQFVMKIFWKSLFVYEMLLWWVDNVALAGGGINTFVQHLLFRGVRQKAVGKSLAQLGNLRDVLHWILCLLLVRFSLWIGGGRRVAFRRVFPHCVRAGSESPSMALSCSEDDDKYVFIHLTAPTQPYSDHRNASSTEHLAGIPRCSFRSSLRGRRYVGVEKVAGVEIVSVTWRFIPSDSTIHQIQRWTT